MGIFGGNEKDNTIDDDSLDDSFQEAQDSLNSLFNSTGKIVKSVSNGLLETSNNWLEDFKLTNWMKDLKYEVYRDNGDLKVLDSPFFDDFVSGLYKPGVMPSLRKYKECKDNEGLSVWDRQMRWNCLLPQYSSSATGDVTKLSGSAISKEDYLQNKDNAREQYFGNVNDLLDWHLKMRELQRQQLLQRRKNSNLANSNKKVISYRKTYHTQTSEDGSLEKVTKIERTFEDGTTELEETKKIRPKDGSPEIVEHDIKTLDSEDGKGWFWGK